MIVNWKPVDPRDPSPEREEGICFLCGRLALNGDRVQDEDGRDFHRRCLSPYLVGFQHDPTGAH